MIMHRYITLTCILLLMLTGRMHAQTGDKELDRLISVSTMLRTADATVYNRALQMLKADALWTPMDELGRIQSTECKPAESVARFKLNRLLSRADGSRKFVASRGDFLNGEDERFDYSLYERSLKAGSSVTFKVKGRVGQQTFVLVPHSVQGHGLKLALSAPGLTFRLQKTLPSGVQVFASQGKASKERQITITVSNASRTPQSFVLINHNSRK